ncbi:hypothetical protein [Auritidibacter ignavus]|uniref:hypothetical protein n=1 Tax=Auritidibacter ignavus TaxID=678932 RepID=UPI000F04205D|nr:hypothetical protein [Auritidibacter ignavus]NIH71992.1 hypothetical protein [Auritidibacter ignavus]RMX23984.1 hypothetical protein DYI20_02345 [Auritidibacter ignavus]WHS34166.1 hypothetical protein QM403_07280 [Auritidibacter ignavus]
MNDEHGHDTAASEALSRLKSSSSTSREPFDQQQFEDSAVEDSPETESPTPTSADPSAEQEPGTTPATPTESTEPVETTEPAPGEPARKSPEVSAEDKALWTVSFNTGSGEEQRKDTLGTRLTTWLDSFGGPDMDKVEADIADTPARLRRHWLKHRARQTLKKRRAAEQAAAERRAREERERLEAEVAEIQQILAVQAAERAAEERERQRLAEMELLKAQQERETQALVTAARELDGTDYVPAPDHRPMLQRPGEELSDQQLLSRARSLLPEWRRRDRIVEKAQAIEAKQAQLRTDQTDTGDDAHDPLGLGDGSGYIPPYLLPERQDPQPERLDSVRRVIVTIAWVLFVIGGLVGLGWIGGTEPLSQVNDGAYHSSATLLSMANWHVAIWPVLWIATGLYTVHQWTPSQRSASRQRRTGWLMANAMFALALWFALVHIEPWGLEIIVWILLCALLVTAVRNLNLHTSRTQGEQLFTDAPIGLLTGWALVFMASQLLTVAGIWDVLHLLWLPESVWAIVILMALMLFVPMVSMTERGRVVIVVGMAWGLAAIIGVRLFGSNPSVLIAAVALLGGFVVLLATENRRWRIAQAEKRYLNQFDDEPQGSLEGGLATDLENSPTSTSIAGG